MELISVIVPIYNVEKYLLRCVTSIQNQSYENLEIILVDDESPDHCPQICDQLASEDSRIKVVHKKNGGLGFARNSGLEVATGSFVTFIDSDDWISEDHIANLYFALSKDSADAVVGYCTSVNVDGTEIPHNIRVREGLYVGAEIINGLTLPMFGPDIDFPSDVQIEPSCCMNLYRMDLIQKNNLRFISEREAVSEDLYFNIDFFCLATRIVTLNEIGYYYYENSNSLSRKYDPKRFGRIVNFYHKLHEKSLEYGLQDSISFRIDRSFLMQIRVLIRMISCSNLTFKDKMREIRTVLNNDLVHQVLNVYPIRSYAFFMRVFSLLMRIKCVFGIYLMIKLRESVR